MPQQPARVLVVEDGDEYLENLRAFLPELSYIQVRGARGALQVLEEQRVDIVVLDMRFDRVDPSELLGDPAELLDGFTATIEKAWVFIKNNQGLYIYRALRAAGYRQLPVLLCYDFGQESRRWQHISEGDQRVDWLPDVADSELLRARIQGLLKMSMKTAN